MVRNRLTSLDVERCIREKCCGYEPPYHLYQNTLDTVSKDFIREFRDKIVWDTWVKTHIKKVRGEEFYKELFGEERK